MNLTKILVSIGVMRLHAERAAAALDNSMRVYRISSKEEVARFISQLAHESAMFSRLRESLNYTPQRLMAVFGAHRISAEDAERLGRKPGQPANESAIANLVYGGEWGVRHLGNTATDDGWRYRGGGFIQTTGRDNYAALTSRLRARGIDGAPDFTEEPERLEDETWAAWAACDFWLMRGCSAITDIEALTRRVNGGTNGLEERRALYHHLMLLPDELFNAVAPVSDDQSVLRDLVVAPPGPDATAPSLAPQEPLTAPVEVPQPQEHKIMIPVLSLAGGLANFLFEAFAPLAKEKLTKEMARHTDDPAIAENIANTTIEAAKRLTGKADPVEAVQAAKADPALVEQVQASVMDELDRLAPLLERMAAIDRAEREAGDASMDAAARRNAGLPNDQDPFLTRAIVWLFVGVMVGAGALMAVLAARGANETVLMAVFAILNAGALAVFSKLGTRFDHRYGSSASSQNKDAVRDAALASLSRRQKN